MSAPTVIYDLTRLATRFSRRAPNGIDRVDLAYARHFLSHERAGQAVLFGRLIDTVPARRIADAVEAHWGEEALPEESTALRAVKAWLLGVDPSDRTEHGTQRAARSGHRSFLTMLRRDPLFGDNGVLPAKSLVRHAPENAVYLNIAQFPLWIRSYFRWQMHRRDIRSVFFLHDLLPIRYPEFFPPPERERHMKRLNVLSDIANGVIVSSPNTHLAFNAEMRRRTTSPPPVLVNSLAVSEQFHHALSPDAQLRQANFFLCIGTIEPRKNHLLLLHVWRELVNSMGAKVPKLLLVGGRGWGNQNVINLLERCEELKPLVFEAGPLSTPELGKLVASSKAVLMPSFAEGFGLPVAEALAAGARVLASDIPAFHRFSSDRAVLLDPLDGPGWQQAIVELALAPRAQNMVEQNDSSTNLRSGWWAHMQHTEEFLRDL